MANSVRYKNISQTYIPYRAGSLMFIFMTAILFVWPGMVMSSQYSVGNVNGIDLNTPLQPTGLIFTKNNSRLIKKKLEVVDLSPDPNYALSVDENDYLQLVDGHTSFYPIWTKKNSVGWSSTTPIMVTINLLEFDKKVSEGILSLHTSKNLASGVNIPRRIDVYSLKKGDYYYSGGFTSTGTERNQQNHWLKINVKLSSSEILLIVHAAGRYVMLDEISYEEFSMPKEKNISSSTRVDEPLIDSLERHKVKLLKLSKAKFLAINSKLDEINKASELQVWTEPAWGKVGYQYDHISPIDSLKVTGYKGEQESLIIGIKNLTKSALNLNVVVDERMSQKFFNLQLNQLDGILSANGELVFDPILPLDNGQIVLSPYEIKYLWLRFDLLTSTSSSKTVLSLRKEDGRIVKKVDINVDIISVPDNYKKLNFINWGYLKDVPIKLSPEKALEDLLDHGVNIHVIHHSSVPQLTASSSISAKKIEKLKSDIRFFRNNGFILLFLNWPKNYSLNSLPDAEQKKILKEWLVLIDTIFSELGVEKKYWALYPVDEPHGDSVTFIKKIYPWIKEAVPDINLYANPISTTSGKTTLSDLEVLAEYIDYWQPSFAFAVEQGHQFFSSLKSDWWVYKNSEAPSKSVVPITYRLLAWQAWSIGAVGAGFWSYSDTGNSSAWDDFDGHRPDWAVVYEGDNGPISSRRWEAVKEGIEDYNLIKRAENFGVCEINEFKSQFNTVEVVSQIDIMQQRIKQARRKLLFCLKDNYKPIQ